MSETQDDKEIRDEDLENLTGGKRTPTAKRP